MPDKQALARKSRLTRFVDLILPPMSGTSVDTFKIGERSLEQLIQSVEGSARTGCLRATSEESFSRSAVLLYRGRAVGCIYNCRTRPYTQKTEEALKFMLGDLALPETVVNLYDLPEEIVLPLSALFLGNTEPRDDDYDARKYMDYCCVLLKGREQSACFAYTLPLKKTTCLGFVYKGEWFGAFSVTEQHFEKDKNFVYSLLKSDAEADVDVSLLPLAATSTDAPYGYSLR